MWRGSGQSLQSRIDRHHATAGAFLNGRNDLQLPVIAEVRGKREDDDLARTFARDHSQRNAARSAQGLSPLDCSLTFCSKEDNVAGIQIADLCAYPCARLVFDPERSNTAFEIVKGISTAVKFRDGRSCKNRPHASQGVDGCESRVKRRPVQWFLQAAQPICHVRE